MRRWCSARVRSCQRSSTCTAATQTDSPHPFLAHKRLVYAKDALWRDLTWHEKAMAAILGYDMQRWNSGDPSPVMALKSWSELSYTEAQAAHTLGYTPWSWDAELEDHQLEEWSPGDAELVEDEARYFS